MKHTTRVGMTAVGLLLLTAAGAVAQDWPQWRGPHRDARVAGFTAPKEWPKQLPAKWKVTVGDGVATPALVGDKLYVFTRQGGDEVIRCLDAATGKELWLDRYEEQGATGPASGFAGPRSSPAVADGKVVTLGARGMLSCLDAASGKVLWRKNEFKGSWPGFFVSSSPIILDSLVIAQVGGGRGGGGMVAYDLATGEPKWKWLGDGPAYASPAPMTVDGAKLVIAMTEGKMVALTAAAGKLVWEAPFAAPRAPGSYNASSPIVDGQTLIYGGSNRGARAVKFEKQGDGFVANELWKTTEKSVIYNTPIVKDGYLYGLSQANELYCLSTQTGKLAWSQAIGGGATAGRGPGGGPGGRPGGRGGRGGGAGYGTIIDAGSVLLALTPSTELVAFEPSAKAFKEVARIKVAESPTYAYPVLSGSRLFIKDQNSVALLTLP